jgi:hypothetical protein
MDFKFELLEEPSSVKDFRKSLAAVCLNGITTPSLQAQLTEQRKEKILIQIENILSGILNAEYRSVHDVQILFRLWDNQETLANKLGQIDLKLANGYSTEEQLERAHRLFKQLVPWIRTAFEAAAYKTANSESYCQRR